MASGSTISTVAFVYKRVYMGSRPAELAMRDHPFYSMINKRPNRFGEDARYFIRYANSQAIGNVFSTIQTRAESTSSKGVQMAMTPATKYGAITIDGVSLARSEGNKAAIVKLTTLETEGVLEEMGDSNAHDLYRTTNGTLGQISSGGGTTTLTLTGAGTARNFKVGMPVAADTQADGAGTSHGTQVVTAVNYAANTIDIDAAGSFANNDFLFRESMDNNSAVEGLADHFPLTAPVFASDSFRGIDRGVSPELLAGVRIDDTATSIEENAGLVGIQINENTKKQADCLFINPINYWTVVKRANAKVEYDHVGSSGDTAGYGFKYFWVHTPAGSLKCYSDPDCPRDRGYVLKMSDCHLAHAKAPVHIIDDDGDLVQRQANDDGVETRLRSITNAYFHHPGCHGVFSI